MKFKVGDMVGVSDRIYNEAKKGCDSRGIHPINRAGLITRIIGSTYMVQLHETLEVQCHDYDTLPLSKLYGYLYEKETP